MHQAFGSTNLRGRGIAGLLAFAVAKPKYKRSTTANPALLQASECEMKDFQGCDYFVLLSG